MNETLRILAFGTSVEFVEEISLIHSDPGFEAHCHRETPTFELAMETGNFDVVIFEAGADDAALGRLIAKSKAANPQAVSLVATKSVADRPVEIARQEDIDGMLEIPMSLNTLIDAIRRIVEKNSGGNKKTLLVVDDIYSMRFLLRKILEAADYNVLEADSAAKALNMVSLSGIDAVLLDVMMQGMNGLELCEKLKNNPTTTGLPIILITARGTKDNIKEGLDAGANAYIVKPFTRQDICAKVEQVLESA